MKILRNIVIAKVFKLLETRSDIFVNFISLIKIKFICYMTVSLCFHPINKWKIILFSILIT